MAGDPPLEQVVTRTWEFGLRGGQEARFTWSIGGFAPTIATTSCLWRRIRPASAISRISARRGGGSWNWTRDSRIGRVTFGGGYTFLDATYRSAETVDGSSNSTNDSACGSDADSRAPSRLLPAIAFRWCRSTWPRRLPTFTRRRRVSVDVGLTAFSGSLARGNENGLHVPDGTFYLGPGTTPAYATVSLGARYQATSWVQLFCNVNNLFNTRYYTAAQLGPTGFTADRQFHRPSVSRRRRRVPGAACHASTRPARRSGPGRGCASSSGNRQQSHL